MLVPKSGPEEFHLIIKTKIPQNKNFSCVKSIICCIFGILTFMGSIKFMLS